MFSSNTCDGAIKQKIKKTTKAQQQPDQYLGAKYLAAYFITTDLAPEALNTLHELLPRLIKIFNNIELLEAVSVLLASSVVVKGYSGLCVGFILYLLKKKLSAEKTKGFLAAMFRDHPTSVVFAAVSAIALLFSCPPLVPYTFKILALIGGYFIACKIAENSTINKVIKKISTPVRPAADAALQYLEFNSKINKQIFRFGQLAEGIDVLAGI